MKLYKKKKLNLDNFVQAITTCFKDDLFPKETGSYPIKKHVKLPNDSCILLKLVSYKNDKYDHYVRAYVKISSDYSKELNEYLKTLAEYTIHFDLDNNTHTCTSTFISDPKHKHIDLLNEWSVSYSA